MDSSLYFQQPEACAEEAVKASPEPIRISAVKRLDKGAI